MNCECPWLEWTCAQAEYALEIAELQWTLDKQHDGYYKHTQQVKQACQVIYTKCWASYCNISQGQRALQHELVQQDGDM